MLCLLLLGGLHLPAGAAQEVEQVGIVIQELSYDSEGKTYALLFSITNPERVAMVIVRVVDGNATDVGKYNVELNMSRTAEVLIDGAEFVPGAEYTVVIQAQDRFGNLLERPGDRQGGGPGDRFILDQRKFTHREDPPTGVEFTIESVNPDFDAGLLTIDLDVPLGAAVVTYDGFILTEGGQKLIEFGPHSFTNTRFQVRLPEEMREGEREGEYLLSVDLTTPENVRSRATLEFKVMPPEPPGLVERIRIALGKNPIIAVAIAAVLGVASSLAILLSRRKSDPLYEAGRPAPFNPQTVVRPNAPLAVPSERSAPSRSPARSPGIRVRVVKTPGASRVPDGVLRSFPITIGREKCDISFPGDKMMSRNHAQVTLEGGRVWIEDTGSMNHTFLGNRQLEELAPERLERVTRVRLGPNTIIDIEMEL
jgi:hypothetical protein